MKLFKNGSLALIVFLVLYSCNSAPSLQKYIVESKENNSFISIDLPSSILKLKEVEITDDVKATLETIKKVNFLALQLTDSNKELYTSEKEKITLILKNPNYKELIKVNKGGGRMTIKYLGDEEGVDEVVIFGSENTKGFALVRVLGEKMNPAEIMKVTKYLQMDGDNKQLGQIGDLIKNMY